MIFPLVTLCRILAAAITLVAVLSAAQAEDDADHDLARDLQERGEIVSFAKIVQAAHETVAGDIVGVTLHRAGDGWTYVIQVVDRTGRRVTLDIDAESAKVLDELPPAEASP